MLNVLFASDSNAKIGNKPRKKMIDFFPRMKVKFQMLLLQLQKKRMNVPRESNITDQMDV